MNTEQKTERVNIQDIDHSIDLTIQREASHQMFKKWMAQSEMIQECLHRILEKEDWDRDKIISFLYGKAKARTEAASEVSGRILLLDKKLEKDGE